MYFEAIFQKEGKSYRVKVKAISLAFCLRFLDLKYGRVTNRTIICG